MMAWHFIHRLDFALQPKMIYGKPVDSWLVNPPQNKGHVGPQVSEIDLRQIICIAQMDGTTIHVGCGPPCQDAIVANESV